MSLHPCPEHVACPGTDSPVGNYSSEAPDPDIFVGFNFGWLGDPLLGADWMSLGCFAICTSIISQEDADLCAAQLSAICNITNNNTTPGMSAVFYNGPASCEAQCPDGSQVTWFIVGGVIAAPSQMLADRIAESLACLRAQQQLLCFSGFDGSSTNNAALTCDAGMARFTFTIRGRFGPFMIDITDGELPPGMTIGLDTDGVTIVLEGMPTTPGNYTFRLRIIDAHGNTASKELTVAVMGITTSSLPDFTNGTPYSEQLTAVGGTGPYTFTTSSPLPTGLTLSASGLLSGTPNDVSPTTTFPITFNVSDASETVDCFRDFTLKKMGCSPPALAGTFPIAVAQPVYAKNVGKLFAINLGNTHQVFRINPDTGIATDTLTFGGSVSLLFYENVNHNLYAAVTVGSAQQIVVINPSTLATIQTITLNSAFTTVQKILYVDYDFTRNNLWVCDASTAVFVINCFTFVYTEINFVFGTQTSPPIQPTDGLAYCSAQDVVAVAGLVISGHNQAVTTINPATLAYINVFDLGIPDAGVWVSYCVDNARLYLSMFNIGVLRINPADGSFATISFAGDSNGSIYDLVCKRIVAFSGDGGENVVAHYIDPNTNAILATIPTGQHAAFYPIMACLDSDRLRVWVGTQNLLMKFT